MHRVKNITKYSVPHFVVTKRIVETLASDGLPCQSYEDVNMLTNDSLNTPPASVFSLESQIASGQKIKRVSTLTMEPSELSMSQLRQLEYLNESSKVEEPSEDPKDGETKN